MSIWKFLTEIRCPLCLKARESTRKLMETLLKEKTSIDLKREYLLPFYKEKWDAEKNKIEQERMIIMASSSDVVVKLSSRKEEILSALENIRKKSGTSVFNNNLKIEYEARLSEFNGIEKLIDNQRKILRNNDMEINVGVKNE